MPDVPIRVIVADDHPIVLDGLQQLFQRQRGFEVVARCLDGNEALEAVRRGGADAIVMDLRMPGRNGLEVLRDMSLDERRACRVVLLTGALRDAEMAEAVELGTLGIVLKESSPETLVECVRAVSRGERWIDRALLTRAYESAVRGEPPTHPLGAALTPRELEVVRLVAKGLRNREIAQRLFISEGTVKIHLHNAYEKLGVDGRMEMLLYAQEKGLV